MTPSSSISSFEPLHEYVVVDAIKAFLQINVHHNRVARLHLLLRLEHRVLCPPSGSKPVTVLTETRVNHGLQHLQQGLLNQPISHRGYPQFAKATVRLGDHDAPHWFGPVAARQ